jgi:hypothetical protein
VAAEERGGGGCDGRHGGVARLRARGLLPPLGPGQLPAPPRRHPFLLGQVRVAAQQVGLVSHSDLGVDAAPASVLRSDLESNCFDVAVGVLFYVQL